MKDTDETKTEGTNNPPDDKAVLVVTVSRILAAKAKKASAEGNFRQEFARAESLHLCMPALKAAIKILEADDKDEQIRIMQKTIEYAHALDIDVSDRLDLFDSNKDAPLVDQAKEAGRVCGLLGRNQDENPHQMSTKAGQAWQEGWLKAIEERNIILSMSPEIAEEAGEAETVKDPEPDQEDPDPVTDEEWEQAAPDENPKPAAAKKADDDVTKAAAKAKADAAEKKSAERNGKTKK